MTKTYRYFTIFKLNNKIIKFGRVKVSNSDKPLVAAKKLLISICKYKKFSNKLKCNVNFYIRETTKNSKKLIYGPYKGSFKKSDKPENKIYEVVSKVKDTKIIQSGGKKYGEEFITQGFRNFGNTCFINSFLQIFLSCDELLDQVLDIDLQE